MNSLVLPVGAQQLPVKRYTASNGLPSNEVLCIERALDGYLWFCTTEGLARFDGYRFQTFGVREGLPHPVVRSFLQARDGTYWVGTSNGVCQFIPQREPRSNGSRFDCLPMSEVEGGRVIRALIEDREGVAWVGASSGLYRVARVNNQWRLVAVPLDYPGYPWRPETEIQVLREDSEGTIWIGTANGVCRRWPDGRIDRYGLREGLITVRDGLIHALAQDADGSLWVGTRRGLYQLRPGRERSKWVVSNFYSGDGLPHSIVTCLFRASDDTLWVGTAEGLSRMIGAGGSVRRFAPMTAPQGLPEGEISSVREDGAGGLWVGLAGQGVVRVGRDGFTTYMLGSRIPWVRGFVQDPGGGFVAATGSMLLWRFDGSGFTPPTVPYALSKVDTSWGESQIFVRDRAGEWWLPSGVGLYRYPAVQRVEELARTPPKAVYRIARDKSGASRSPADIILRVFEDSRGDIWIGTAAGLSRWQRSTSRYYQFTHTDGIPYRFGNTDSLSMAHSFAEDRQGNVWIGFYPRSLARFDGSRLTFFTAGDGVPEGPLYALHVDHAGRLWIGSTEGGLARIDDTAAQVPKPIRFSTAQGLASDRVVSLVEDTAGRIYAGTGRGVDRVDVESGRVRHYNETDGLPVAPANAAFRDETGALWFGTSAAAARLIPDTRPPRPPPTPLIRAIRISGVPQPVSDLGEASVATLSLGPGENHVEIEYSALRLNPADQLRYQVRLAGSAAWGRPTEERVVNYARLGSGRYQFEVRAINEDDIASANSAIVAFTIASPLWLRPWFIGVVALALSALLYSLYRYRVSYLLALERMRTHLALDLHDEVGSGLAEIAVSSEVARQDASPPGAARLARIAERFRELRSGMADIVWAVDPSKDK
ncbi:MAG: two-component regulator propeller domain-containing protein, partial [Bryobacteraceae bacterium]